MIFFNLLMRPFRFFAGEPAASEPAASETDSFEYSAAQLSISLEDFEKLHKTFDYDYACKHPSKTIDVLLSGLYLKSQEVLDLFFKKRDVNEWEKDPRCLSLIRKGNGIDCSIGWSGQIFAKIFAPRENQAINKAKEKAAEYLLRHPIERLGYLRTIGDDLDPLARLIKLRDERGFGNDLTDTYKTIRADKLYSHTLKLKDEVLAKGEGAIPSAARTASYKNYFRSIDDDALKKYLHGLSIACTTSYLPKDLSGLVADYLDGDFLKLRIEQEPAVNSSPPSKTPDDKDAEMKESASTRP